MDSSNIQHTMLELLSVYLICVTPILSSGFSLSRPKDDRLEFRVNLRRRDEGSSLAERLQSAMERSKLRVQSIVTVMHQSSLQADDSIESPVRVGNGEFLMEVGVGTPTVAFNAVADTGSDLIWTQCLPCKSCYNQSTPIFDPSKSSTYSTITCKDALCDALGDTKSGCKPDCTYYYRYGDGSSTSGDLSYETVTIGSSTKVPKIAFGCGHDTQGQGFNQGGGLVGLGRGALSLISQLGDKVNNKFSYCLLPITDPASKTSPMIFGSGADLSEQGIQTISFIKNQHFPTFYYIPVKGISVNGSALNIPEGSFDIDAEGNGGMIIDSGTTLTYLPSDVYKLLEDAVNSSVKLKPGDGSSVGLDLCYEAPSSGDSDLPTVTFNFEGDVKYELPAENTFVNAGNGLLCLAIVPSDSVGLAPSIFGNIQQQNFHILYDTAANKLSFQQVKCDSI